MSETELRLRLWRGGQIGAERLASVLLHLDGFSSVDPQCPLGGPDGLKDVLCEKNGWKYVAAIFFPTKEQPFRVSRDKFTQDLGGVVQNTADGIVFVTNQALTPGERSTLEDLAAAQSSKAIIYHLERVRGILDSPSGYGARLQFLDIEMSREEQLSFFSRWNQAFSEELREHSALIIREISKKIDSVAGADAKLARPLTELVALARRTISLLRPATESSDKRTLGIELSAFSTSKLTLSDLCTVHRALLFDSGPSLQAGVLRATKVWIGPPGSSPDTAIFVPPDPERIPELVDELLAEWRAGFTELTNASVSEKILVMARFHQRLLQIHPFVDGNGRLARFLLSQQALELLKQRRSVVIEDRLPYFEAIGEADRGDYTRLVALLTQAIYGVEFVPGSPCQMSGRACPGCGVGTLQVAPGEVGVACDSCGLFIPAVQP